MDRPERTKASNIGHFLMACELLEQPGMTLRTATNRESEQAVKLLAKSLYKELTGQGYGAPQIVALSSELLRLLTASYQPGDDESAQS